MAIEARTRSLLHNLPSPRRFEGIPKLSKDISAEGNRSARLVRIVYGSEMTKG